MMHILFALLAAHVTAKGIGDRLAALEPKVHELLNNVTAKGNLCPGCTSINENDYVKYDPKLQSVCFTGTVVKANMFAAFYNLECFDGPDVKVVQPNAFFANYNLVTVSDSLSRAAKGEGSFYLTYNLVGIPQSGDIRAARFIKSKASSAGCPRGVVTDGATTFEKGKYMGCSEITVLNLPNADTIPENFCAACWNLEKVYAPKATDVGDFAFYATYNLGGGSTFGTPLQSAPSSFYANYNNKFGYSPRPGIPKDPPM